MNYCHIRNTSCFFKKYFLYIINFVILIILTVLPFMLVIRKFFSKEITLILILLCLIIQVLIHIKFFLHLNLSNKYKWNVISIIFAFVISTIILSGSYWVIKSLNHNMYSVEV
ncbi:MAG: cytochrome o ubiquinol oxidase subunit IV [Buchnera aphidicola (Schlechtendalia peitan)]